MKLSIFFIDSFTLKKPRNCPDTHYPKVALFFQPKEKSSAGVLNWPKLSMSTYDHYIRFYPTFLLNYVFWGATFNVRLRNPTLNENVTRFSHATSLTALT
jgi:hypothetical protein